MYSVPGIGALAATIALTALAGKAIALPPIEAFGSLPLASQPKLSPDGKYFATVQPLKGRPAVVIYDTAAAPGANPTVVSDTESIIESIRWARNDRLLVTVVMNLKVGEDTHVEPWYRTLSVDTKGQNMTMMFGHMVTRDINYSASTIADLDLDDPHSIFMPLWGQNADDSLHYNLYRVDVATGDAQKELTGSTNPSDWIMDGHGHVVARVEEANYPLVDHLKLFKNGEWTDAGTYDATEGHGAGISGLSEDGNALVEFRENTQTGTKGLVRLDLATAKESSLFVDAKYDIGDEILTDDWTGRVIGVAIDREKIEYQYFDPRAEALQKGLEAAFPGMTVHAVSWDTSKNKLIVEVEGPRAPTAYYYLDRSTHEATAISLSYPKLTEEDLGEMKPYPYKARDGLDIPAYITLPPGRAAKNLPAVVMPHGGPDSRDTLGFDWWAQFLANRGYVVLQPNYRGSSGYGVKFTQAGLHQWGLKMQDDITDGVHKMIADGIADPKRICIVGGSYGGYAALAGAAFTPDLYACAISFAGVSDLQKMLRTERTESGRYSRNVSFWTSRIGSSDSDSDQLKATSPAEHADAIKCPVLLMHGEGDSTVRIDQSETMERALEDAHKQVEFIRFPGEDHYINFADTRIRVLTETEAFLKKNIGN